MINNPLLSEWTTAHQTPPFQLIRTDHYAPAIREAIREAKEAIERIATQAEKPTFENTIVALELSSQTLDRCSTLMSNMNECHTDKELQDTVMELTPEMTRFENGVWMDTRLFDRVKAVYDSCETRSGEKWELVDKYYQRFVRNGVNLDAQKRRIFSDTVERLALLSERFNQNVLADTNEYTLHITDPSQLSGLPPTSVNAAKEEAALRGVEGWVFTLHAPSYRPFMAYADNRTLREQMWRAYNDRGNRGNSNDNNAIVRDIVNLRLSLASLLGYDDYASFSLCRTMAQTRETVVSFLDSLRQAALPYARKELEEVTDFASHHGANYQLMGWDFSYWSERLKKERYDFDSETMRPFFQLEQVRKGIFNLYGLLYGLTFTEAKDVQVYHEDVKVYEVRDGERLMGLLYLDLFPRSDKRGGAWMTEFRAQSNLNGHEVRPLIQVVCNFTKPTADTPSLLSFDEVETFMHEMGHAMHGMLSDVHYPSLSGTSVRHDFVEMPSQVMENWCRESEFLATFAHHFKTGELMPQDYIERIRRSETFLAGWLCLRQLNFGTVDMDFHTLREPLDYSTPVELFEHNSMTELLPTVEGCCTSTAFTHIFCGGYAAGYYGYKWAEVLDADIFARFKTDGIFNRDTAMAFRNLILSRGGSEHPSVLFRNFMHRDPCNGAFLKRCGFVTTP